MANNILSQAGGAIGNALAGVGNYTAQAAAKANAVSAGAQAAQGAFNQNSANIANSLGDSRTWDQYAYNSAQAAEANSFTEYMWDKAAAYNMEMFERQMDFNAKQAQINRNFQKEMDSTKYARAVLDMEKAGLNPILAVTNGISASGAGGSTASVSAPSMGSASGIAASGGLLNGVSASEGNYQGQMEYMSGILGLISAALSGFSSAFGSLGSLGELGEALGGALAGAFITKDYEGVNNKYLQNSNPTTSTGSWFKNDQAKAQARMDMYYNKNNSIHGGGYHER